MTALKTEDRKASGDNSTESVATDPAAEAGRDRRRRTLRLAVLGIALVIGAAVFGQWLMARWSHVYVNDSRIAANIVTVSSETAGRVIALPIMAGDRVAEGDLLAGLETREAELQLQQIDAEIARVDAEQSQLLAEQAMIRQEVASRLEAAGAEIAAAEAEHEAAMAGLEAARSDFQRVSALRERSVVPAQRFEEAQAAFLTAQQGELRTGAGVRAAQAAMAVIEAEAARITVLDRQIAVLDAQKTALLARREQQIIDLDERTMHAAFDGVIDATFVDVGEYVSPGTRLLMYHDPSVVWVDANVKETDFRRLTVGAPATVTVDAYPGRSFEGKVVRLGQAATSQFALLPSPNPSGNFTKVTQRLPVRIAVEQDAGLLRPGMMVEVEIDVVD